MARVLLSRPAAPRPTLTVVLATAAEAPCPAAVVAVLRVVDLEVRAHEATSLVKTVAEVVLLAVVAVPHLRTLKRLPLVYIIWQT
jgi:hypothetical protein